MKILYYGVFDGQSWRAEYPMLDELVSLGNKVFPVNFRQAGQVESGWEKYRSEADLIFIQNGKGFLPELMSLFDLPVVYFASEASLIEAIPLLSARRKPDFVIAHARETADYCQENKISCQRLHNGFNQNFYFSIKSEYLYPLTFIGTDTPRRRSFLYYLQKKHVPLKYLSLTDPQMINQIYNQSKIVLHCQAIEKKYLPTRLFEVMPTQSCLLSEDLGENYDDFFGNTIFFQQFFSLPDLYEKIIFLLENEAYRKKLVAEANRIAINHTWKKRMQEFQEIFNLTKQKYA